MKIISDIIENLELKTMYEIKRSSEFNMLEYFHIIKQKSFDLHHDVFEGAAVDVMNNWTTYFVRCVFFLCRFLIKCWSNLITHTVTKLTSHKFFTKQHRGQILK